MVRLRVSGDHLTPSVIFDIRGHPQVSRLHSSIAVAGCARTSANTSETQPVAIRVAIHVGSVRFPRGDLTTRLMPTDLQSAPLGVCSDRLC
jgi:hypothetical protein